MPITLLERAVTGPVAINRCDCTRNLHRAHKSAALATLYGTTSCAFITTNLVFSVVRLRFPQLLGSVPCCGISSEIINPSSTASWGGPQRQSNGAASADFYPCIYNSSRVCCHCERSCVRCLRLPSSSRPFSKLREQLNCKSGRKSDLTRHVTFVTVNK